MLPPVGFERYKPWYAALRTGAAFNPVDLPDLLAYYDIRQAGTLFQDTAGITPVAVATDPIGRVNAVGPAGAPPLLQAVEADRGAYQTSPRRCVFGSGDSLVLTLDEAVGSDCTVFYAIPGLGAQILAGQTIGTTFTVDQNWCAFGITLSALPVEDTARLTEFLNDSSFGVAVEGQGEELLAGQDGFTLIQEVA